MARSGLCRLTNTIGKMAKCHLIPQAFTKPEISGKPLIQIAAGEYPTRRRTSWYDRNLVTNEGESLLGRLDDWGIKFLRRKRLVWSGWPVMTKDSALDGQETFRIPNTRRILVEDPARLRLFLLSLLWRAAASDLPDFAEVQVSDQHLEHLRQIIVGEVEDDPFFFSCNFFQLSTIGPIHNMSPIRRILEERQMGTGVPREVFRFYFDGLVIWFNIDALDKKFAENNIIAGMSNELIFPTHPFTGSWAESNLYAVIREIYPAVIHSKLLD